MDFSDPLNLMRIILPEGSCNTTEYPQMYALTLQVSVFFWPIPA